jgi:hypothetical protein
MTAVNMARHRNNPNMPFWRMIKEGNDHFEVTKQEPKVDFCEKKYVFDAAKPPNATRDPVFEASAKCPAYVIPDDIADAVRQKQQADDAEMAKLVAKGTPMARLNTGIDGGMNKVFAAKLPDGNTGLSDGGEGQSLSLLALSRAPGTIPSHVNPPHAPSLEEPAVAATAPSTRMAAAAPSEPSEGFFSSLARKVGFGGAADTTATAPPVPAAKPKVIAAKRTEPHPEPRKPETRQAAAKPALKPSISDPASPPAPAAKGTLVGGAQPIVPASSFDSRFSAAQ